MKTLFAWFAATVVVAGLSACAHTPRSAPAVNQFPEDGVPPGWVARHWADVHNPPPEGAVWRVENGLLKGSSPRGTWLLSEKEYSDFRISFEWKLPERGNSGFAIRAPLFGDPAYDGIELQMVDARYYNPGDNPTPLEPTGSLYDALAPKEQVYKAGEWNKYEVTARGSLIKVVLNGILIQDINLDTQDSFHPKRHDGTDAPTLKDRPRMGHIGFQELSRDGGHVEIRNIQIIDDSPATHHEWQSLSADKDWRGYKSDGVPEGWHFDNGTSSKSGEVEDLVTKEPFKNFELELEWKIGKGGNSGVFYRGTHEYSQIYWSAPEYQLLDDANHDDGKNRLTAAGADYALYPCPAGVVRAFDEWNQMRIVVTGAHVEHWLNGQKVVEYEVGSPDWKAKVAASKFAHFPHYGLATSGLIGIQGDHPGTLSLRHVRFRQLP